MKETLFYKKLKNKSVRCETCNHRCLISEGKRGVCGARENRDGKLVSLVYGKTIAENIDPIEKKPLFHFLPNTFSYSIATVGCNLRCLFCQNWEISQWPKSKKQIIGESLTPKSIVENTQKFGCQSIAYTYTEPTIFFEYALDTMKLAKKKGLFNIFVTNGYMTEKVLKKASLYLDAVNVDLKSFNPSFYQKICGAKLEPILKNLKLMKRLGFHIEITTLIIPGLNDSKEELKNIASFIFKNLGKETVWHISRFFPAYKLLSLPPTPISKIKEAVKIGKEQGLDFVFAGNVLDKNLESTFCPKCNNILIEREGYSVKILGLEGNKCTNCKKKINIFIKK